LLAGSLKGVEPTELGKQQFFNEQSEGRRPVGTPDPYYKVLTQGKEGFDFMVTEYHHMYKSGEWWGFLQLWKDWKGERWLLPHLLKWYKKETGRDLPDWIDKEIEKIEEI
jgi:hypothetical protein